MKSFILSQRFTDSKTISQILMLFFLFSIVLICKSSECKGAETLYGSYKCASHTIEYLYSKCKILSLDEEDWAQKSGRRESQIESKSDGVTADSIESFVRAIEIGDVKLVKIMLERTTELLNIEIRCKEYDELVTGGVYITTTVKPLHIAVMNKNRNMIEMLISKGADINAKDGNGATPLIWALERCIIEKGEDDDFIKSSSEAYRSLALLLVTKGASVTMKTGATLKVHASGSTPLHCAVLFKNGSKEVAELLVSKGAIVNAKDDDGYTPLHRTVSIEMAEYLVSKGADVNAENNYGDTPLHKAVSREIAEFLVSKGADINAENNHGDTPLYYVFSRDIAEFLVSKGADVNAKCIDGDTPLHTTDNFWIAEFLISKGAGVNTKNNRGETPLHRASNNDTVVFLVSKGADVNARNNRGETPVHLSITEDYPNYKSMFLIVNGADVNAKDNKVDTPLHKIARQNYLPNIIVIELLIAKGADINKKNYAGKTPLQVAREMKSPTVPLLKKLGAKE